MHREQAKVISGERLIQLTQLFTIVDITVNILLISVGIYTKHRNHCFAIPTRLPIYDSL